MAIKKDKRIEMYIDRIKLLEGVNHKKEESLMIIHRQFDEQRRRLEGYAKDITTLLEREKASEVKIERLEARITALIGVLVLFGSRTQ